MEPVNILDARNSLSRLIAAALAGDDVVISKRGRPVVRLVPVEGETHGATDAAVWLEKNGTRGRMPQELDAQITAEREGWE